MDFRQSVLTRIVCLGVSALFSGGNVGAATHCDAKAIGDLMAAGRWKVALAGARICADEAERESPAVGASSNLSIWIALDWRLNVSQLQSILGDFSGADVSLKAANQWTRAYGLDNSDGVVDTKAYITITKALLSERRGDRKRAIEIYSQAPLDGHANARIARLLLDNGDREGARRSAGDPLSSREPSALAVKGELAELAGNSRDATDLFKQALNYLGPMRAPNEFAPVYFVDGERISAKVRAAGVGP